MDISAALEGIDTGSSVIDGLTTFIADLINAVQGLFEGIFEGSSEAGDTSGEVSDDK